MRRAGLALILIFAGLASASAAENRCGRLDQLFPVWQFRRAQNCRYNFPKRRRGRVAARVIAHGLVERNRAQQAGMVGGNEPDEGGHVFVFEIGFVLGVVAMLTNTFLLLPIICIVFVLESLSVITQTASKKIRGKKIFLSTPIHHHFEALGWPETQVTMRFWMISAIGAILGIIIFLIDSKIPPLFK